MELLTDIDMIHFFKQGSRSGISQCSDRKHEANNKYMPNYDPNEKSSFIMYLNASNLYGPSMPQQLSISDFGWLSEYSINNIDLNIISNESDYGFVLEADIEYPSMFSMD